MSSPAAERSRRVSLSSKNPSRLRLSSKKSAMSSMDTPLRNPRIPPSFSAGLASCLRSRFRGIARRSFRSSFRFADCRERFHVELLVVGISRHFVHLNSLHQQHAHAHVRLFIRREPYLVINKCLLKDKARTLL